MKLLGASEVFGVEKARGNVRFPREEAFCLVISAAESVGQLEVGSVADFDIH